MQKREPLTAMQQAMLRATVRASLANRKPAFAPLGLIPQSTKANQTFVLDRTHASLLKVR